MTNSIYVPRGLAALFLDGHPKSEAWLAAAEAELQRELREWVSPGGAWVENPHYETASADASGLSLQGELAFARQNQNGTVRLAVLKGADAQAAWGPWRLQTSGTAAVEIEGLAVAGEGEGPTTLVLTLPQDYGAAQLLVDDRPASHTREGANLTLKLPPGCHTFALRPLQTDDPH